ncbi:MAG: peptidoglycan-binding protein [Patescibacteria group bacterium]|nr:peptidoglycan-binding protein [Patescibacteria group bacterium]
MHKIDSIILSFLAGLVVGGGAAIALLASFGVVHAQTINVCPHAWAIDMKKGDSSLDVYELQKFLNLDPDTEIAGAGAGSPGSETLYFGQLTEQAVERFQEKYADYVLFPLHLYAPTGYAGKATRKELNAICGGMTSPSGAPYPIKFL